MYILICGAYKKFSTTIVRTISDLEELQELIKDSCAVFREVFVLEDNKVVFEYKRDRADIAPTKRSDIKLAVIREATTYDLAVVQKAYNHALGRMDFSAVRA